MVDRDSTTSGFGDGYELPAELREAEICRPQCLVEDAETITAPLAVQMLGERLGATPGEVIMWIRSGDLTVFCAVWLRDGLRRRAEFDEYLDDQRARTEAEMLVEYRFLRAEVEQFEPSERFLSFLVVTERLCARGVDYDMARAIIEREYRRDGALRGFTAHRGWRNPFGIRLTEIPEIDGSFLFLESQVETLVMDQFGIEPQQSAPEDPPQKKNGRTERAEQNHAENLRVARRAMERFPERCQNTDGKWCGAKIACVVRADWLELTGRPRLASLPLSQDRLERLINKQIIKHARDE